MRWRSPSSPAPAPCAPSATIISLRELSRRSGVSLSYLSEIERGRKPGSVAAMTRIAALGVTIDSLVIGEQRD